VYVRAMRTAAAIASAPVFRNCTLSAQGMTPHNRSATSTSSTRERRDVSARDGVDDGPRDIRLCVAKCNGAERHRTVEILVAIDVGDATTHGLREVRRADGVGMTVERLGTFATGGGTGREHTERSRPKIGILMILGDDLRFVRRFSVL
jgi:hypothetical protein